MLNFRMVFWPEMEQFKWDVPRVVMVLFEYDIRFNFLVESISNGMRRALRVSIDMTLHVAPESIFNSKGVFEILPLCEFRFANSEFLRIL